MNNLPNFLRKYSCGKDDGPNWGSLRGGRYKIPKEQKLTFFKLVSTAVDCQKNKLSKFSIPTPANLSTTLHTGHGFSDEGRIYTRSDTV